MNTYVFSDRDDKIDPDMLKYLRRVRTTYSDSELGRVLKFFLREVRKNNYTYSPKLEKSVMRMVRNEATEEM